MSRLIRRLLPWVLLVIVTPAAFLFGTTRTPDPAPVCAEAIGHAERRMDLLAEYATLDQTLGGAVLLRRIEIVAELEDLAPQYIRARDACRDGGEVVET
jgi:hypothetical protein